MKLILKNRLIYIACFFCILIIIFQMNGKRVISILNIPEKIILVNNPDQYLIKLLVTPESLPNNFDWFYILISQNLNENNLIDSASTTLGGFYNGTEIGIINKIILYADKEVIDETISPFSLNNVVINEFSILEIYQISDSQQQTCSYSRERETLCFIEIPVSNLVITLDIRIREKFNNPTVEEMLNIILITLNENLKRNSIYQQ